MDPWRLSDVPRGGRPRSEGGGFHLSFRSGSRASGASASAAQAYVTRSGEYAQPDRDPAIHVESGHMPAWAQEEPEQYWEAADLYERANGRLYVSADFALPRELSPEEQIELAQTFTHDLTDTERLPFTMAVHAGLDAQGHSHNPHVHLMFSERQHDGYDRTAETWFKRANRQDPERGGAPKSRTFHGPAWVEQAREQWAERTNEALARAGSPTRVDHRSYARQGIDREPGRHLGPAAHVYARGRGSDRLDDIAAQGNDAQRLEDLDREIAQLEAERDAAIREGHLVDRILEGPDLPGWGDRGDGSRGR